jgi:hypothetical protein
MTAATNVKHCRGRRLTGCEHFAAGLLMIVITPSSRPNSEAVNLFAHQYGFARTQRHGVEINFILASVGVGRDNHRQSLRQLGGQA